MTTFAAKVKGFAMGVLNSVFIGIVIGAIGHMYYDSYFGSRQHPSILPMPVSPNTMKTAPVLVEQEILNTAALDKTKLDLDNMLDKVYDADLAVGSRRHLGMKKKKKKATKVDISAAVKAAYTGTGTTSGTVSYKGKGKSSSSSMSSSSKGKGSEEIKCIPLYPTPAPTKGKGKGKSKKRMLAAGGINNEAELLEMNEDFDDVKNDEEDDDDDDEDEDNKEEEGTKETSKLLVKRKLGMMKKKKKGMTMKKLSSKKSTAAPTFFCSDAPSMQPSNIPSNVPSAAATSALPSLFPSSQPSGAPLVPGFTVLTCVSQGDCIYSHTGAGSEPYIEPAVCVYTANRSGSLNIDPAVGPVSLGTGDTLMVNGVDYVDGQTVSAGDVVVFMANADGNLGTGFGICLT